MIAFTVYGKPQPAGSKRAFVKGGRAIVVDDAKGSRPWKQEVAGAAISAMCGGQTTSAGIVLPTQLPPLEGPLAVAFTFYVTRPKGHYGAKGLRPSAPTHPTTRPDVLKLARAVEDAMSGIVYRDDSQIVLESLRKEYGEPERVEVKVWAIGAAEGREAA